MHWQADSKSLFYFFAVCGAGEELTAMAMAFTLRELRSALHECVLKPQSQQSSLILRLWRTLYLAFLGLDATRLVQEA